MAPRRLEGASVLPLPVEPPMPSERGAVELYAALDLGTNSCRMLIARPRGSQFEVVDSFSKSVQLGTGLEVTGRLGRSSMLRVAQALHVCRRKLRRHDVTHMRLVATEACRRARNGSEFLGQLRRETGLTLEVIAPEEEARLAVVSCAPLVAPRTEQLLVVDIGGGSTELVWIDLTAVPRRQRALALMEFCAQPGAGLQGIDPRGDDPRSLDASQGAARESVAGLVPTAPCGVVGGAAFGAGAAGGVLDGTAGAPWQHGEGGSAPPPADAAAPGRPRVVDWISVPLGVATLRDQFRDVTSDSARFALMSWLFEEKLAAFGPYERLPARQNFQIIGTSGTVTTVAASHLGLRRYDRNKVDGLTMTSEQIDRVIREYLTLGPEGRRNDPRIGRDRHVLIMPGAAILQALLRVWPTDRLTVADRGLREGLLYAQMLRAGALSPTDAG